MTKSRGCAYAAWRASNLLDSATDQGYADIKPSPRTRGLIIYAVKQVQAKCPVGSLEKVVRLVKKSKMADARALTRDILRKHAD